MGPIKLIYPYYISLKEIHILVSPAAVLSLRGGLISEVS